MTIFCFICKRHIVADNHTKFAALGHSDQKVAQLKRGPVGVYARPS